MPHLAYLRKGNVGEKRDICRWDCQYTQIAYYSLSVVDLRGVKGVQMHPPLAASNVFLRTHLHESIKWLYSSSMQQQPGTVTHSCISSLILISRRLCIGLELIRDIQFGFPAILNNSLASYDNNFVCHECVYVTGSGHGNPKIFGHPEPPFLNF